MSLKALTWEGKTKLSLICLFTLVATIAICKSRVPHQYTESECTICHGPEDNGARINGSITSKCMTCHTTLFEKGYMHPVDMKPIKITVPIDLPLDNNGMLTCNTCHDVHRNYGTPMGTKSHFLRRLETGKAFCDICHKSTAPSSSGHQMIFLDAHTHSKSTKDHSGINIDDISRNCLTCHDGSVGSSVMLRTGDWRHAANFLKYDKGGKHPIGMNYEKVRRKSAKSMLKPKELVDKRIRFFNKGCVGCGSCHDPYSTEENKLVITVEGEALCFSCHKL